LPAASVTPVVLGYGEVQPVDHPGLKLFTIGVILAGCSAGLWVIGSVVEFMAEGTINKALGKRRMARRRSPSSRRQRSPA
jgi:voltage-gated potassium channel